MCVRWLWRLPAVLRLWALLNLAPLNPTLSVNRGIQGQLVVLLATQPGARMLPGEMLLAERGEGGKEQGHAKKAYVFYMETLSGGRHLKGLPYIVFLSHLCDGPGSYGAAGDRHPRQPEQDEIFPCVEGKKPPHRPFC